MSDLFDFPDDNKIDFSPLAARMRPKS
ncbi:MAG: hypothetical protein ACJA13_003405, partial [Paraglaciecola sp.]